MSREDQEVNSEAAPDAPEPVTEAVTEVDPVAAERDQLQAELAELQDRLLRTRAEFENFRRRSEQGPLRFPAIRGQRSRTREFCRSSMTSSAR